MCSVDLRTWIIAPTAKRMTFLTICQVTANIIPRICTATGTVTLQDVIFIAASAVIGVWPITFLAIIVTLLAVHHPSWERICIPVTYTFTGR